MKSRPVIHIRLLLRWVSCFCGRPSTVTAGDRGRCESRPPERPSAGRPKRRSEEHLLSPDSASADARAARRALETQLGTDALEISATLPTGFADAVERYVELLLEANTRLNLTRVTEPSAVARLHVLDSLSVLPLLDSLAPASALDLGSGGGVPGIVLALARPDVSWTLVDSVGKKCDALRAFVAALDLHHVTVVTGRAETLGHDPLHRERNDVVTARACASMPVLVEYALPLIRAGGALIAWKGPLTETDDEMVRGAAAAVLLGGGSAAVHRSGLPALGDHRLVVVPKESATPAGYPRRAGTPAQHPLPH